MTAFVRYPHTPHLTSLSARAPRGDKVLSPKEASALLDGEVTVEEKVDGGNLGLSVDDDGALRVQNRGAYLDRKAAAPQFRPLWGWLAPHEEQLVTVLGHGQILFGEWCYARHSVAYSRLPDWFLAFDIYDRRAGRFWSVERRNRLVEQLALKLVPFIARGRFKLQQLPRLIGPSQVGDSEMEGIVVRRDEGDWQVGRAKLVRAAFVQAIDEHWSHRRLEANQLARKHHD